MTRAKRAVACACILAAACLGAAGCAAKGTDLAAAGVVSLERPPSGRIYVSGAHVRAVGNTLVVSGRVRRLDLSAGGAGHVDVAVIGPGGRVLAQAGTAYIPRIIPRKGARESYFTVRLDLVPPDGSKVRAVYHKGRASPSGRFDCGSNAAVPRAGRGGDQPRE